MNRTQTETEGFELALRELINKHKSPYLTCASIIGVLYLALSDIDKQASNLPIDGDELHEAIGEHF